MNRVSKPQLIALLMLSIYMVDGRCQPSPKEIYVPFSDTRIQLIGRTAPAPDGSVRLGFPGSGFVFRSRGSSAILNIAADSSTSALTVVVDNGVPTLHLLKNGENHVLLIQDGASSSPHVVRVFKRTETGQGLVRLENIQLTGEDTLLDPPVLAQRKLLFVGDSVTCGAGVDRNDRCVEDPFLPANNAYDAFGMVLGRRLDAQATLVCYGGRGVTRDWRGLTFADGVLNGPDFIDLAIPADDPKLRSAWDPKSWQPDAVVIAFGTNDFNLQSTKPLDAKQFVTTYSSLLKRLLEEYPTATLFATEGPIVTNPLLPQYLQQAVDEVKSPRILHLASKHYPGNGCDGHPTRDQQRQIADDLESALRAKLQW
jgi:lysophospholipase L1-like esterase